VVVLFVWVGVRARVRDRDGVCWIAMQAGCSYIKGHDVTYKERYTVCMQRREREVIWCGLIRVLLAQRGITKGRPCLCSMP
jgi:hypothetical protein